uniref:SH3 domain-containing protein n=1 Tax=Schizophyllum commune (strain H4-8 / FGSC 9210) TaxID=578458 RepID=D8Q522_SCHCM
MARRQPSTTSLSKYARSGSPIIVEQDRALDFCNAFWGLGDGGVDVLFARMRGASRTTDELRNFWKERASIEEDYAKRLAKLAKGTLGRDEIGELRNSLDTIRTETERQAGYHLQLAQQIRTDLEGSSADFYARQVQHKKTYQAMIEKQFRQKQEQEARVMKAREKYEADCLLINSYTAQSTLVQGRDLDKITSRLERAQRTVQANERDFANFAKTLQTTAAKWEQDWKDFCDSCQDLEEDRLDFMRDNMWAYANAVSTVCVTDDESCEKMRLSLEQMETEKEMENFVLDYGTGNRIPDPPAFVDYNKPDAIPSASSRPTARPAHFTRTTQRRNQGYGMYPPQGPPQAVQPPPPPTQPPPPAPPVAQPPPPPVQAPPPAPYVPAQTPSYAAQPAYQPGFGAPPPQQQPPPQQVPYTAPQPQGYGQPAYPAANQPPAFGAPPPQQPAGTQRTLEQGLLKLTIVAVKALYDYTATIDEEFDFQAGDIIAVTATPEDGWWSGELLDEDRRQRGRHVFPSNFVCLF